MVKYVKWGCVRTASDSILANSGSPVNGCPDKSEEWFGDIPIKSMYGSGNEFGFGFGGGAGVSIISGSIDAAVPFAGMRPDRLMTTCFLKECSLHSLQCSQDLLGVELW